MNEPLQNKTPVYSDQDSVKQCPSLSTVINFCCYKALLIRVNFIQSQNLLHGREILDLRRETYIDTFINRLTVKRRIT